MRTSIKIFEILRETGSCEEAKQKAIGIIDSNPNVICELDVYGKVIDKEKAELLASVLYYGKQHGDRVQISGRHLNEEETGLIEKAYRNLDKSK